MNFYVRSAKREDASQLYDLARQFTLLNLPADKKIIGDKLERSTASFKGELSKAEAEYMFVVVDREDGSIAGSSMISAKNGTPKSPNFSFKVLKKERFSRDLGVGFIHQILRLNMNTDGPTEVGGLVVDKSYRRRPEKVGKLISLCRLLYIGMHQDQFEKELHAEMAPPLTDEGRSEFWESLGRRFTGMPYKEADMISQQNNGFIQSLFPEEDIYLCLLDSKARLVLGRVAEETQPALHLLNRIGFRYKEEVDPFDGGPHLSCPTEECLIVKNASRRKVKRGLKAAFSSSALIGIDREDGFLAGASPYAFDGDSVVLPESTCITLDLAEGDEIYVSPEL